MKYEELLFIKISAHKALYRFGLDRWLGILFDEESYFIGWLGSIVYQD